MSIFLVSRHLSPYFDPSMALLRPAAGRSHQPGFGVLSFAPCGAGFAPGPGFSAVFVGKTWKFHGKWWTFMVSCPYLILIWLDGQCFFWVLLHEFSYEYEWICWRLAESCWVSSKCSSHEWRQRTMRNHKDNGWVIKPLMEWWILLRWQLRLGSWIPGPGEW